MVKMALGFICFALSNLNSSILFCVFVVSLALCLFCFFCYFVLVILVLLSLTVKIKSNLLQLLSCFFIILVFGSGSFKTNSSLNEEASKNGGSDHIAAQTFTFRELAAATRNFRAECLLGEGGFGRVYKGLLESTNQVS